MRTRALFVFFLATLLLSACFLTTSFDYKTDTALFAVRGDVVGLATGTVRLTVNGGHPIDAGEGPFAFPAVVADKTNWVVALQAAPPDVACSVNPSQGTINGADAMGVVVSCVSSDVALASLTLSSGPLSPTFDPTVLDYGAGPLRASVLLPPPTTVTVSATAKNAAAQITINGSATAQGTPSAPIAVRVDTTIDVLVNAPSGKMAKYTIHLKGTPNDYIKSSNNTPQPPQYFGASLALSNDTLVVGAVGESSKATGVNGNQADTSMMNSGAAFVFVRSAMGFSQQAYIKASNTRVSMEFGTSVAISGDTLAIGAPNENSASVGINGDQNAGFAPGAGAVYVFVRSGATWTQQAYIKPSNTHFDEDFGRSVALQGDTLVVGAPNDSSGVVGNQNDKSQMYAGSAFVFTRSGNVWTQQAYLQSPKPWANDHFGSKVAVSNDTIVVGAYGESSKATGVNGDPSDHSMILAGAAYVFKKSGNAWPAQAYLKASNTNTSAFFGWELAIDGDTLVVGSRGEGGKSKGVNGDPSFDAQFQGSGAAYVFVRSGATWSQQAYVKASNTRSGAAFGSAVAIAGDWLLVGSDAEPGNATGIDGDQSNTAAPGAGAAYLFSRKGTTWAQTAYVKPSNTRNGWQFGATAVMSSALVVVGAPYEASNARGVNGDQTDTSAMAAGAVYAF